MTVPPDTIIDIGLTRLKKVLIAEDEQNIASLIEDWLSNTYEVTVALNGKAALQKVKWEKPHAILMDIVMPDMSGYEVVRALQGDIETKGIPIIAMTAKAYDDSTVSLIKNEPNVLGFINKPFKPGDLKRQLVQVLAGERTFPLLAPLPKKRLPPSSQPGPCPHDQGSGSQSSASHRSGRPEQGVGGVTVTRDCGTPRAGGVAGGSAAARVFGVSSAGGCRSQSCPLAAPQRPAPAQEDPHAPVWGSHLYCVSGGRGGEGLPMDPGSSWTDFFSAGLWGSPHGGTALRGSGRRFLASRRDRL